MTTTVLQVKFRDKDRVKALGARWDAGARHWYVPEGRDLAPFASWLPEGAAPPAVRGAQGELAQDPLPAKGVRLSSLLGDVAVAVADRFKQPVWVLAEVLSVNEKPNGHVYLELCDGGAKARASIWADTAKKIIPKFERATSMVLGPNLKLLVLAQVRFSAEYGFGLVIQDIDPEYSLGDLEARKREILRVLKEEGVLDRNRRLPSPWDFHAVLVVAPAGAAGLGDFLAESDRLVKAGVCRFEVVHARFQGEGAPREIIEALTNALAAWTGYLPDAVIVIRGGGAVNDLAWLNDLALTRYLATLPVPVITGIGHERDRTTLDEVAHQACDTPSKAIGFVTEVIRRRADEAKEAFRQIRETSLAGVRLQRERLERDREGVETRARRLVHDARVTAAQAVGDIRTEARATLNGARSSARHALQALETGAQSTVRAARRNIDESVETVRTEPPRALVRVREAARAAVGEVHAHARGELRQARATMQASREAVVSLAREHVQRARSNTKALLHEVVAMGPQKTLDRGFAIVRGADGKPVTRAESVQAKDALQIEFQDGTVAAAATSSAKPKE